MKRLAGVSASTKTSQASEETRDSDRIVGLTTHEEVYRRLREQILYGGIKPGSAVTLRGLADELGVSSMPVREAVRRLIAERALLLQDNRRVMVPPMTRDTFEQILFARRALEPELAARALPKLTKKDIAAIEATDMAIDRAMRAGDTEGYMRANHQFHFSIYRKSEAWTLVALVESIWLQFGPFMRMAYGRIGTSTIEDHHEFALAAMQNGDVQGLRSAIDADIGQGMGFIGEAVLTRAG
ncbi:MAG: GntR family transcriptional regulator [Hyphomicrobium sp. 32-62-53]|nr:MAG: GntR family transcriptional regulator [Hyphomicrobium sp. 12-62-95]OYY00321.1 MAG: GntR family transcriptional regulator [Hyphomicrobium sp. 32-62-53]